MATTKPIKMPNLNNSKSDVDQITQRFTVSINVNDNIKHPQPKNRFHKDMPLTSDDDEPLNHTSHRNTSGPKYNTENPHNINLTSKSKPSNLKSLPSNDDESTNQHSYNEKSNGKRNQQRANFKNCSQQSKNCVSTKISALLLSSDDDDPTEHPNYRGNTEHNTEDQYNSVSSESSFNYNAFLSPAKNEENYKIFCEKHGYDYQEIHRNDFSSEDETCNSNDYEDNPSYSNNNSDEDEINSNDNDYDNEYHNYEDDEYNDYDDNDDNIQSEEGL